MEKTRDPYHILVSELMLWQTQVSRVIDYYDGTLPSVTTLLRKLPGIGAYTAGCDRHVCV